MKAGMAVWHDGNVSRDRRPVTRKRFVLTPESFSGAVSCHNSMSRAEKAAALKKQRDEELEKAKQAALERLAKKEAKQRTLCNLEITPWEADQDLIALHKKLKETVVREGLKWSEGCKLVDVGYGIKKMLLTAVLSMNLSMDAIIEEVADEDEGILKDEIQSFTMTSMSLL